MGTVDELKNELQALRKEIAALRNENVAIAKELMNQNQTLANSIKSFREQSIFFFNVLANHHGELKKTIEFFGGAARFDDVEKYLTRVASTQTAEFIIKNMLKVKAFKNRKDYLLHILTQTEDRVWGGVIWSSASKRAAA